MKLPIERTHLEAIVAAFPELEPLREQLLFGNRAETPFHQLTPAKLTAKYCRHKSEAPSLEVFTRCSIFRGMELEAAS